MRRLLLTSPWRALGSAMLALTLASAANAHDLPTEHVHPDVPPHDATLPIPGAPKLAKNQAGQLIAVRDLDDPANPFLGQYSAYDRWFAENYIAEPNEKEGKHFGG